MAIDLSALSNIVDFEMPSAEEVTKRSQENPTCMHNWFPAVEASDVKYPASKSMPFPIKVQWELCDNVLSEESKKVFDGLVAGIREFGEEYGYPLFIKNSLSSAKHSWKETCFIDEKDTDADITKKIGAQLYEWMCYGHGYPTELIVREFIHAEVLFNAFHGDMPITQEFRLFTKDGEVVGYQPYWPLVAFERQKLDMADVAASLEKIATPSPELLEKMIHAAKAVDDKLEGDWSIDFLIDLDGEPYLIDMAEAFKSFKCDVGYVELPKPEQKPAL